MARLITGLRIVLIGLALALVVFAAGFFSFANMIEAEHTRQPRKADGIVVLTGGTARIEAGVELLSRGYGKRLLISGVHRTTTRGELRRLFPKGAGLFRCCIDLDRRAINTSGNASETRNWAEAHGFTSLIVVTSSYHMPRTMVELRRAMSGIELIPFAVEPSKVSIGSWWSNPNTARLLLLEYIKYVPSLVRSKAERLTGLRDGKSSSLGTAAKRP